MNIHPMGNRVLVERRKTSDLTTSGIYIPETAKEKSNVALVLAVGPGKILEVVCHVRRGDTFEELSPVFSRQELFVKAGDRVLFGKYSGVDFEHEGKTLLFLREEEIFGILLDNVSEVR